MEYNLYSGTNFTTFYKSFENRRSASEKKKPPGLNKLAQNYLKALIWRSFFQKKRKQVFVAIENFPYVINSNTEIHFILPKIFFDGKCLKNESGSNNFNWIKKGVHMRC